MAKAGEFHGAVAKLGDGVFRLPPLSPLDAYACVTRPKDRPPQLVVALRRRGIHRFVRFTEQQPESRARGAESGGRRDRYIKLEMVPHQEDPIYRRFGNEVEQRDGVEPRRKRTRPVVEDIRHRDAIGNTEGQVEI